MYFCTDKASKLRIHLEDIRGLLDEHIQHCHTEREKKKKKEKGTKDP
jgi:hypothetical protein